MSWGPKGKNGGHLSPLVPVVVALAICGVLFAFVVTSGRDDGSGTAPTSTDLPTASSATTAPPPAPDPVPAATIAVEPLSENPPRSYRITYAVVENGLPRTETLIVARPFESLLLSTRNDDLVSGTATSRDRLWTYLDDRDGWLVIQPELHRAAFDQRPLAAMAMMMALGLAEEREPSSVLDRPCRVFLTGQPLTDPGATPPSEGQTTEACIDANGLVLHERWEIGGELVSERTATAIELGVDVAPESFDPTPVVDDAPEFEALLSTIAVPADEETLARLQTDITPPDGFALEGTVLRPRSPDRAGSGAAEIVRFYSDGVDLIEVAEVVAQGGADPGGLGAVPVEIDGPETWFVPDFRASAVRTRLSETAFVEIRGTNPTQLIGLLDTLVSR